jgi:hypothetical protein
VLSPECIAGAIERIVSVADLVGPALRHVDEVTHDVVANLLGVDEVGSYRSVRSAIIHVPSNPRRARQEILKGGGIGLGGLNAVAGEIDLHLVERVVGFQDRGRGALFHEMGMGRADS